MRVLPYFNNVQLPARRERLPEIRPAAAPPPQDTPTSQVPALSAGEAPGTDVFIPSSPVAGVVYSYKTMPGGTDEPETVIKSGNYRFYQLNGSTQRRETGTVGGKLDLKG